MNKEDDKIIKESIEEPLSTLIKSFPRKENNLWLMKTLLLNPKELIVTIFTNYFDIIEPGGCQVDKASFVTKKLFESIEQEKVLSLQYTYAESKTPEKWKDNLDKKCYWCPCTFKDTNEAFNGLLALINPIKLPSFLAKQKEVYEPYRLEIIEENKKYYLKQLSYLKPIDRNITVEDFINENLKKYPQVSFHLSVLNSKTGIVECFYDELVGWKLIDNHNLRKRKIIMLDDRFIWKNEDDKRWRHSSVLITIEGEE